MLIVVLVLGASVAWLSWKFEKNCAKVFDGCTPLSLLSNAPLKGERDGRINILLAGNSVDDPNHAGADLTDSIMLVSINPKEHTGYMLSIPRDLYVHIPDNGYSKINTVYKTGQREHFSEAGYAPGGMGLLEKVVSEKLDVPIHYYALINYTAFKNTVDAVGGVTVAIDSPDPRGLYDPYTHLDLKNGRQKLDGQVALNYARARGDGPGSYGFPRADFDRTKHQREMLVALKDKSLSFGTIINPIKLGKLLDAVGKNVQTDIQGNNVRRFANIVKNINAANLQPVGLNDVDGQSLLKNYSSRRSGSALIPAAGLNDYSDIQALIKQLNGR